MESTLFTNRWYALRPSRLVKNKPQKVELLGKELVLWRNKEKQIVIQDNICPHRGAKLSMGTITKGCIECPYHGWTFDCEGLLKEIPADMNSGLIDSYNISTYEGMESGGLVWFCNKPTEFFHPPIIKEMLDRDWIYVTGYDTFEADWLTSLENSLDISHVNFVHSDFGDPENGGVTVIDIKEKTSDHLIMKSSIHHKSASPVLKFTENPNVNVRHDLIFPNTVSIKFWVKNILEVITYVTYTPLEGNRTLINWVFLRKPRMPFLDGILNDSFRKGMIKALKEDKDIVESLENPSVRLNIFADKIQILFRKTLEKMKANEPTVKY